MFKNLNEFLAWRIEFCKFLAWSSYYEYKYYDSLFLPCSPTMAKKLQQFSLNLFSSTINWRELLIESHEIVDRCYLLIPRYFMHNLKLICKIMFLYCTPIVQKQYFDGHIARIILFLRSVFLCFESLKKFWG